MEHGSSARAAQLLAEHGILKAAQAEALGVSRRTLHRLAHRGEAEVLRRGVYGWAGAPITEQRSLVEAMLAVPHGAICLTSALVYWGMTLEVPLEVWVSYKRGSARPRNLGVGLRLVCCSAQVFGLGLEQREHEGVRVVLTNPTRTVVDCFKWRRLVGSDVALEGLKAFVHQRLGTTSELIELAQRQRVYNLMRPYLEALL